MADVRQFRQDTQIIHGTTAQNNAKLTDIMPLQHEDLATQTNQMKKISLGQCLCEPFAVCNSNNPANGAYVADCVNFPDFTLQFTDGQGNNHSLIGLKVRVLFNYGITYGSVSGGTYPTLNINGSGAIPLLAQGKTMGAGAISAGQTVEFTIIPYGNSLAFDADSNVRESTSDYTIYTDGTITYSAVSTPILNAKKFFIKREYNDSSSVTVDISSIRLEQYDSFLVVILGAYGYGGLAMAACATNDGTITSRQWITRSNNYCDFSLSNYKNLTITNLAGGTLNTLGIMVVKLGN